MIAEKYPMGKGERMEIKTREEFDYNINNYCCIFLARFTNVHSKLMYDNPISASKCFNLKNAVMNNGRIVSADEFVIAMTNVDFFTYEQFYTWDEPFEVSTFYRYKADYLPREFVDSVLTFYEDKTKLKGVVGKESEYLHGKENVNSCYGMTCTDILRDLIVMDGDLHIVDRKGVEIASTNGLSESEIDKLLLDNPFSKLSLWSISKVNREQEIDKYNTNPQRFLFYPWGLFVTAYARRNLFSGILACGDDYVYADTDSIKILNYEKHEQYFKEYNEKVSKRLETACKYHGFDVSRIRPKTVKGVEKPLGVWDDETKDIVNHGAGKKGIKNGVYSTFKTLGAKRYIYLAGDELHVTIAGSNKENTAKYLVDTYGKYYAFYKFDNNLVIPPTHSGRKVSCYIDHETSGEIIDYMGVKGSFHEMTSVHMEQGDYTLSLADAYVKFFLGYQLEKGVT